MQKPKSIDIGPLPQIKLPVKSEVRPLVSAVIQEAVLFFAIC